MKDTDEVVFEVPYGKIRIDGDSRCRGSHVDAYITVKGSNAVIPKRHYIGHEYTEEELQNRMVSYAVITASRLANVGIATETLTVFVDTLKGYSEGKKGIEAVDIGLALSDIEGAVEFQWADMSSRERLGHLWRLFGEIKEALLAIDNDYTEWLFSDSMDAVETVLKGIILEIDR